MARALRIEYEGALYHVTARGNERKNIFFTKGDYERFKEYIAQAQQKFQFVLHCYVLMTNHYHLLIETPEKNLQRVMHYINGSYSTYTNVKRRRCGHLFQGRYKAIIVDKDSYLLELSRYIHLNPVRAKMVEKPERYDYSSYRAYVSGTYDGIVSRSDILGAFSDSPLTAEAAYKAFVEGGLEADLQNPLEKMQRAGFLGDEDFVMDVLGNVEEEGVLGNENVANRRAIRSCRSAEGIVSQLKEVSSRVVLSKKMT